MALAPAAGGGGAAGRLHGLGWRGDAVAPPDRVVSCRAAMAGDRHCTQNSHALLRWRASPEPAKSHLAAREREPLAQSRAPRGTPTTVMMLQCRKRRDVPEADLATPANPLRLAEFAQFDPRMASRRRRPGTRINIVQHLGYFLSQRFIVLTHHRKMITWH